MTAGDTYHISYPSGCFTNTSGDVDYVGTAYTFGLAAESAELYSWGQQGDGELGHNQYAVHLSSPTQIPGTCLLYTSPSPRDGLLSRMPSSA